MAGVGGSRKPTQLLALTGTLKTNPGRYANRANEPKADVPFPADPPAHLTPAQQKCWREIVDLCHPGVLCAADSLLVEHGAMVLWELRDRRWKVHPGMMLRLEVVLSKLGMTPADRSRVSVLKGKEKSNPYSEFKRAGNDGAA